MRMAALLILSLPAVFATAAEVQVVGDRCLLVDGKPFFAVGIYQAGVEDFAMLAEAGVNMVHTYGWEGSASYANGQAWLDAAEEHGLKAWVGLYRPDVKAMNWEQTIERVKAHKDHPALLAWHTMDEPDWDTPVTECLGVRIDGKPGKEYMPAAYQLLHQLDGTHPVTAVVCHYADVERFMDSVDVLQADYYPVPPIPAVNFSGTGFRGISIYLNHHRRVSQGGKPFWFVAQAFDYSRMKKDVPEEWQRFPTQREMRTMTYMAIACGARGIVYWSLSRLRTPVEDPSKSQPQDHWEWLSATTRELKQLQPLLTADTPELRAMKNNVASMVKSDGSDIHIIAANYERTPTQTVISVPGIKYAVAEIMFEGGEAEVVEGELRCSFEEVEARVYRLRKESIQRYAEG